MSEWHDAKKISPKKAGVYLIYRKNYYDVLEWTDDLYALDDYEFYYLKGKKDRSGWYGYDSEGGYLDWDIDYWTELPDPPEGQS